MNYVGQKGLKANGNKVWHEGNFAPASKADVSHNHSTLYEPKNTNIQTHISNNSNPHAVTKSQVGLGSVDNVQQASKTEFDAHKNEDASVNNVHGLRSDFISLGSDTLVNGDYSVTIGCQASTAHISGSPPTDFGVAIGPAAHAAGEASVAIGQVAQALSQYSVALGRHADVGGRYAIAIGDNSKAQGTSAMAIGRGAKADGNGSVVIGNDAFSAGGGINAVSLGVSSSANGVCSVAIGTRSSINGSYQGVLGTASTVAGPREWIVPGNFTVNGTKNFEIPHPKPEKKATHRIRHASVEAPTAGETLYRYRVQATKNNDTVIIDLPDYFIHLNKDVQVFVTPQGHFGQGYGVLNEVTEQLEIHCQYAGEYNVLVMGTRNDEHQSVLDWDIKGVEREIGESWTGETYVFSVNEIIEVEEIKEVV